MVKKTLFLSLFILALLVVPVIAQESAGPATFEGSETLWIAIIIGIAASVLTLFNASRLSGTKPSTILWPLGFGMMFVVLGFISVVVAWVDTPTQKLVHDIFFIIGYLLMGWGAVKLTSLKR